jgi:Tol biopolymer transport system component
VLAGSCVAEAAFPGRNGRLAVAFAFGCEEGWQVATMRSDGSDLRVLTDPECNDKGIEWADEPDWSPDGGQILFVDSNTLNPLDASGLAMMAADGSGQMRLPVGAGPPSLVVQPSFAPDGRHVAYVRARNSELGLRSLSIWRAALDGSDDRRLRAGSMPRWSPNGRRIAYLGPTNRRRQRGTWLMNARTGERIRRLSRKNAAVLDWAPDGRTLVFTPTCRSSFDCDRDLFILRADGKILRRLTATPRQDEEAAVWSPNGRRIAFARRRDVNDPQPFSRQYSLWTMTAHGTHKQRIFTSVVQDDEIFPRTGPPRVSWQPRSP